MMTHNLQPTAIDGIPPKFGEEGSNDVAPLQQESSSDAYPCDDYAFPPNSINEEGAGSEGGTSHNGHLIGIPSSLYMDQMQTVPFLRMLQSIPAPFAQPHCSFQMLLSLQDGGMQSLVGSVDPKKLPQPQSCVTAMTAASSCARSSPQQLQQRRNRKKRKQAARPVDEVESQRLSHIAVERNRRRLMNHHLQCLRSLMPPSYAQKDDQASTIGAAIDYVKTLEQLLQSLQAQKRMMMRTQHHGQLPNPNLISQDDSEFILEMKDTIHISSEEGGGDANDDEELCGQVEVKVMTLIDKHVNLKIEFCGRKKSIMRHQSQLVRAIAGLEERLSLTVLHLNISSQSSSSSSSSSTVHYSLSLRMEDDCKLEGADAIAASVADLFRSDSDAKDAVDVMQ